jgi:aminoglycoside phosphotransferase (APT) family kinase protein
MSSSAATSMSLSEAELVEVGKVMSRAGVHTEGPLTAHLLAGGRSNLTYRVSDAFLSWVLRMPPRAGRTPSAHDVAREFKVMAALSPTDVPVAEALALCEDDSLIGGPFSISEFVAGRTVQTQDDLASLDDATLARTLDDLVRILATLHQVDHIAVGLERFGRPDGYAARQVARWTGQWELVGAQALVPLGRQVAARLNTLVPAQDVVSIVHGDFRIDNTLLVLDDGQPRVAAVVDWELSTIGDPVADVAMMCAYRDPSFDLIVGAPSAWTSSRLPSADMLATAYEGAGGTALVDWEFHLGLAYFKIAVIAAGIDHRARAGGPAGTGFDTSALAVEPYLTLADKSLASQGVRPSA